MERNCSSVGQFSPAACTACGTELTTAIPNPPAIIAPITASIFLVFIFSSFPPTLIS
jgi:hypothetical protein